MIILIIMLLFAISVDLFIMYRIYKACIKLSEDACKSVAGYDEAINDIACEVSDVDIRLRKLETRNVQRAKRERKECEDPSDDFYGCFLDCPDSDPCIL